MTRSRRLRIYALLAAGVLAVAVGLAWWFLPGWSARIAVWGLSSFFNRPASVTAVRYGLLPFRAEVSDVRVSGPTSDSEPFLYADQVTIIPAWRTLFTRRITLSQVLVDGFRMRINAFRGGGDDIPHMGSRFTYVGSISGGVNSISTIVGFQSVWTSRTSRLGSWRVGPRAWPAGFLRVEAGFSSAPLLA
jgi:hypothetical protein